MTTVSKIADAVFPFNRDSVASEVAARRKTTSDLILKQWDESRQTGIAFHKALQTLVSATIDGPVAYEAACHSLPEDQVYLIAQLDLFLKSYCEGYTLCNAELPLESKGVKGVVDAVLKSASGSFIFCEWKFGSKLWMKSFGGKKALGALREIDDCKYQKANLQVTIYEKLAADNDMQVEKSFIVHFDPEKDEATSLRNSNKMKALVGEIWKKSEFSDPVQAFLETDELSETTEAAEVPQATETKETKNLVAEDVMVDLETLSTSPNSHILTIGAIRFRRDKKTQKLEAMDTFYRRIDFKSNDSLKRDKSSATVLWWMEQSASARKEAFAKDKRVSLAAALQDFISWFGDAKYLWCHGAAFDAVILEDAMQQCGLEPPYKFWNVRDTRTVYDLHSIVLKKHRSGTAHHALHDCYSQIEALRGVF